MCFLNLFFSGEILNYLVGSNRDTNAHDYGMRTRNAWWC